MTITTNNATTTTTTTTPTTAPFPAELPADVALVMSAMDAGRHGQTVDRRAGGRRQLRTAAALRLFANAGGPPIIVYARDVGGRTVGFLARHRLPLGYGGTIELPGPTGEPVRVACVLLRCAPAAGGWYDGCAAFNRLQPQFEA
jgi:hypothetical protein